MMKRIVVQNEEYFDFPEKPSEIIDLMNNFLESVPSEYRDSARIEIEPYDYYGSASIEMEFYYYREETKEEKDAREVSNRRQVEDNIRKEMEIFEKLKAKYGK